MRYRPEFRELLLWLKKDGNSPAQLASALGYKSSSTIGKWIKMKRIPERQVNHVLRFIRGESYNVSTTANVPDHAG